MYRLLVADDERIERMVLCKKLRNKLEGQCEVFEAENGREALEIYEREKIQIAILDIEMPGINGLEAAKQIRARDPFCCIIFLTAFDDFSYARGAVSVRALEYLLKPYDEAELLSIIDEAMWTTDKNEHYQELMNQEENPTKWLYRTDTAEMENSQKNGVPENVFQHRVAETIRQYIQEKYQDDISMQDAANAMNYSDAYFCKLFKQCFGKSFTTYLMEYRVNEARKLLHQPTVNVREVSRAVGYLDSNYFAKVFKRVTGLSPSEYRKKAAAGR